jgi:DNA polymerase-1
MGAGKLAHTLKISRALAKEYIEKFNSTFKVLVAWLRKNQDLALERGYAKTYLGRKRYFKVPQKPAILSCAHLYQERIIGWKKTEEGKNRPIKEYYADGLATINFNPLDPWDENLPKPLKDYYSRIAGIKREGGNSPIQGGNADLTKIAMYKLRKWIRDYEKKHNNGEYLAHVCLQVYDEILVDCPEEMAEILRPVMDRIMKEAGEEVIKLVPVETACAVADFWLK